MIDDILRERDEKLKADAKKQAAAILEAAGLPTDAMGKARKRPGRPIKKKSKTQKLAA